MKKIIKTVKENATTIETIYLLVMLLATNGVLLIPEEFFNAINGSVAGIMVICLAILGGCYKVQPFLLLTAIKESPLKELNKHKKVNKILEGACLFACILGYSVYTNAFTFILFSAIAGTLLVRKVYNVLSAIAEITK